MMKKFEIELNEKQEAKFVEWCSHIKALYGEVGTLTWMITPTGIGDGIEVHSKLANVKLDLTDVDSW